MNQILDNPFPFSDTNKRYHTFSYAMKKQYGRKIAKIPLNAGFSCPNRDGTKGVGGCAFCSSAGSGDTILQSRQSLQTQYQANLKRARKKWPECLGIAYFQSFSNTYAPLETLKKIYIPFFASDEVCAISIATRTDCFCEETAAWLEEMQAKYHKEVWVEFGLQSIHPQTAKAMNFCHTPEDAKNAIALCQRHHLRSVLHLINGLPGETREMMLKTARFASSLQPGALKIHMLHLLDNSRLGQSWLNKPFSLLGAQEYVSIVCDQLEVIDEHIIIERVTGDGLASDLLAPLWTRKKTQTANDIDKELLRRNSWQGAKKTVS
ncbi:TIGR01212 family radical SAM protein [Allobaculum fili]|uniref:TIGR01212 family radical SAM protein n=1 Tax=Allobaculum fili TaxID=2834460 RepID=UPI001E302D31|nr:TIGR01212 family radical SAM protein [Allobaculum fili]